MSRCTATTAKGGRCRKQALEALDLCAIHAGARVGRPTKLDTEVGDQIIRILSAGGYVQTAVSVAGVAHRTFNDWMARGVSGLPEDEPYRVLRERVEEARGNAETRHVALISRAAAGNWQAAAWLLERQYPERWGRPERRKRHEPPGVEPDPFAEVDELAEKRRKRGH